MVEGFRDYSKGYDAENLIECIVSRDKSAAQVSARLDDGKWSKHRCKVLLTTKQADRQKIQVNRKGVKIEMFINHLQEVTSTQRNWKHGVDNNKTAFS